MSSQAILELLFGQRDEPTSPPVGDGLDALLGACASFVPEPEPDPEPEPEP